jgi:hypothetical protein
MADTTTTTTTTNMKDLIHMKMKKDDFGIDGY